MIMNKRVFVCKTCGKDFTVEYRISNKKVLHFCSKSCKTVFQRQGYFNKTQLENAIKRLIRDSGMYLTKDEILNGLNISSKTLTKFNISILALNRNLGMKKPYSIFETHVCRYLDCIYDDLQSQVTFDDCRSDKGFLLKFDFYSPSNGILIEADGNQHNNINHVFSSDYTMRCDEIKELYANSIGLTLIRIPYSRNVTQDYILQFINH